MVDLVRMRSSCGVLIHLVPGGSGASLCGFVPSRKSAWSFPRGEGVLCASCDRLRDRYVVQQRMDCGEVGKEAPNGD